MKRLTSIISGLLASAGVAMVWRRRRAVHSRRSEVPARGATWPSRLGGVDLVGRRRSRAEDLQLADRVRRELFGGEPVPVGVSVHRGAVTLRGEVDRLEDIALLDGRARRIEGVRDVTNLLRLPQGTRA